jgi:hypothetical protein
VGIIKQPSLSFSIPFGEEIHYTCVNGKDCGENDCEFNFSPVMMQTKLANLVQSPECITTTTTTDSVTTTMENIDPWNHTSVTAAVHQEGIYTTRFQARWDLAKDLSFGNAEMDRFTIVLTCTTEGSTIALIATDPDDSVACEQVDEVTLQCEDTDEDINTRGAGDEAAPRGVTYVSIITKW